MLPIDKYPLNRIESALKYGSPRELLFRTDYIDRMSIAVISISLFFAFISKAVVELGVAVLIALFCIRTAFSRTPEKEARLSRRAPLAGILSPDRFFDFSYLLYPAVLFLSSALSRYPREGVSDLLTKHIEYIVLGFLVMMAFRSSRQAARVCLSAVFAAHVVLLIADCFWQYIFKWDFLRGRDVGWCYFLEAWHPRLKATFENENVLAGYIIFPLFITLGFVNYRPVGSARARVAIIAILASLFLILFSTYTRGAWIALVAGLFVYGICRWHNLRTISVVFAVLGVFFLMCYPAIHERTLRAFQDIGGGATIRFEIWKETLKIIRAYPFFGAGFNQFHEALREFNPLLYNTTMHTHNMYLKIAVETGLVGLAAFLFFIGSLTATLIRALRSFQMDSYGYSFVIGFISALAATLVYGIFDNTFFAPQIQTLFWILTGFSWMLIEREENAVR